MPMPAMGCDKAAQEPGTWKDVTPPGIGLDAACPGNNCSWGGCQTILLDPVRPSDIYLNCDNRGTYKSMDCGMTWQKVNTGANGDVLNQGRQWTGLLPVDSSRGPDTPPTLYMTLGYGKLGFWRSTNGGKDWTDAWGTNIVLADGTNVAKDVGVDVGLVYAPDPSDPNYLVAVLHGYFGSADNSGIFVSTNHGDKWVDTKVKQFSFTGHADVFYALDRTTWMVTHVTSAAPHADVYRTTDSGQTWNVVVTDKFLSNQVGIGMQVYRVGSAIYVPAYQGMSAIFKSTNNGATWTEIKLDMAQVFAMVATSKDLYITGGASLWDGTVKIEHASLTNDTVWKSDPVPTGLKSVPGGIATVMPGWAVSTNDGAHDIIVTSNYAAGAFRYVVP
jgi:hypothetical protein